MARRRPGKIWSRDLGEGYSSIAAADGILYTMYRKGDRDVVVALAADSGKTVGSEYDAPFVIAGREADIVQAYPLSEVPVRSPRHSSSGISCSRLAAQKAPLS